MQISPVTVSSVRYVISIGWLWLGWVSAGFGMSVVGGVLLLFIVTLCISSYARSLARGRGVRPRSSRAATPIGSKILRFGSISSLSSAVSRVGRERTFSVGRLPTAHTTTRTLGKRFISLHRRLLSRNLQRFASMRLTRVTTSSLRCRPRSDLVMSPCVATVLGNRHRIRINSGVYHFIRSNVVVCSTGRGILFSPGLIRRGLTIRSVFS